MAWFKWYRRLRGGTWYLVRHITLQDAFFCWVRTPYDFEVVIEEERH